MDLVGDGPEREPNYERRRYLVSSVLAVERASEEGRRYIPEEFDDRVWDWKWAVQESGKFTKNAEWAQLIKDTNYLIETSEHLDLHPDDRAFIINGFLKHYLWPCTNQVYGVRITNEHDWDLFMKGQLKRLGKKSVEKERAAVSEVAEKKGPKFKEWSLDVPENANDFAEWFKDRNTGKPIFRPSPPASDEKKQSK
jgi:hypothetical protein